MTPTVSSIIQAATRKKDEPLNIISACAHNRYQSNLAKTGHVFYFIEGEPTKGLEKWDRFVSPLPNNCNLISIEQYHKLKKWISFDSGLSQYKFGQYQVIASIAKDLGIPLISLDHTQPLPFWTLDFMSEMRKMSGDVDVFISEHSRTAWGWKSDEAIVVNHGIDTETFRPYDNVVKKRHILSVVRNWIQRGVCCGYDLYREIIKDLPAFPVGDTPGLSRAAKDVNELVEFYNEAQIFVNTSQISPIPMSLLEAQSCGCACVSTATCAIPEAIQNGYNGYMSNDPKELRYYLEMLLDNPEECRRIGQNARQTILEKYSLASFVDNWKKVFQLAIEKGPQ